MSMQTMQTSVLGSFVTGLAESSNVSTAKKYTDVSIYSGTHNASLGRAGSFSIDDYSLDVTAQFNSLSINTGAFTPVDIIFKYNCNRYNYLKNIAGINCTSFGGYLTNYNSFLAEIQYSDKKQILCMMFGEIRQRLK